MRLRPEDLQTIRQTVLAVTQGEVRVRLFGSRLEKLDWITSADAWMEMRRLTGMTLRRRPEA